MSSLDLGPATLDEFAAHLRQLNRSTLEVEMITVGEYRLRLKSEMVAGQIDQEHRIYKIVSISKKDERPPGGTLR